MFTLYTPWEEWKQRTGWQSVDQIVAHLEARIRDLDEQRDEVQREIDEEESKLNEDDARIVELHDDYDELSESIRSTNETLKRWGYKWNWDRQCAVPVE